MVDADTLVTIIKNKDRCSIGELFKETTGVTFEQIQELQKEKNQLLKILWDLYSSGKVRYTAEGTVTTNV